MKARRPTHEEIAARAYQIFLERGGEHGHDRDDWLQAEYELMQLPTRKLEQLAPAKSSPPAQTIPLVVAIVHDAVCARRHGSSAGGR